MNGKGVKWSSPILIYVTILAFAWRDRGRNEPQWQCSFSQPGFKPHTSWM